MEKELSNQGAKRKQAVERELTAHHTSRMNEFEGKEGEQQRNEGEQQRNEGEQQRNEGEQQRNIEENVTLRHRFGNDQQYRKNVIHSIWLFWAYVGLGWMSGQIGPSFHDLRLIMDKDLDTASWLFTIFYMGTMSGSLLCGLLFDRSNTLLFIALSVLLLALSTGLLPWCKHFSIMLVARFLTGLAAGSFDTGGNADMLSLWGNEAGPYMQALHFCFGLGGIISPLITEPFLATKSCRYNSSINTGGNISMSMMQDNFSVALDTPSGNATCSPVYGDTQIQFAYVISFIVIGSSSVPFFVMFLKFREARGEAVAKQSSEERRRTDKLTKKQKIVPLLLLCGIMLTYNAVEETFAGYLATFCTDYFKWSTKVSSFATSILWASFSFGRFSGIFLSKCYKPATLLGVYNILLVVSLVGLLIAGHTMVEELVWVSVALGGFAMSIIFASLFTWTEESIMRVSGAVSSIIIIAGSVGLILNPLLLGHFMDNFSPLWFVYMLLVESCLCLVLFVALYIVVYNYSGHSDTGQCNIDKDIQLEDVSPVDTTNS